MGDVLRTVHRLRKAEERRARVRLAEAEAAFGRSRNAVRETERLIRESWSRAHASEGRLSELQTHHHDVLRLELDRRRAERLAEVDEVGAGTARAQLAASAMGAKVVELVADARQAETFADLERRTRTALDEQGLQSWWRRTA